MKIRLKKSFAFIAGALVLSFIGLSSFNNANPTKEPKAPVVITDQNFDEVTAKGVILVDFWAVWCRPCRMMGPLIDTLATEMDRKAVIGKLDVDKNPVTSRRFAVSSIPTFIIFKDGKAVKRLVGMQTKETLVSAINEVTDSKRSQ